jgi:hypothetical protein
MIDSERPLEQTYRLLEQGLCLAITAPLQQLVSARDQRGPERLLRGSRSRRDPP